MAPPLRIPAIAFLVLAAVWGLALLPGPRERPVPPNAGRCTGGDPEEVYWLKRVAGLEYTDAKGRSRSVRAALLNTSQKCIRAHCRNSVWDGPWESWHVNGGKAWVGAFRRGLRVGTWTRWDAQGKLLQSAEFDGGTGHWVDWYENGVKSEEGEYVNGEPSGLWRYWSDAGELTQESELAYGLRDGESRWYAPDGGVTRRERFRASLPLPPAPALEGCRP
jgi:antitoxin component YwqK of YwqJK toxin-antitoxin module